ncbi:MAG: hypothetical protein JNK08_06920 [Sediminibacterium sp.]|nr:hypothetical protein [Sediminibacterium sp.]
MIDLHKLEERFKVLFEQETEDSFKNWLLNSKGINLDFLGDGNFLFANSEVIEYNIVASHANINFTANNITAGNTQYAMAA